MTDINSQSKTFKTSVQKINFEVEESTNLSQTMSHYETVKTAKDLTGITFTLKLKYESGLPALEKDLSVTDNNVSILLSDAELGALSAKRFIAEIHETENSVSKKITEGYLQIT